VTKLTLGMWHIIESYEYDADAQTIRSS
jgi:hypothetical protein